MYSVLVEARVRRGFQHLNRRDFPGLLRSFARGVHFRYPGVHALAAEYWTKVEVADWFHRLRQDWPPLRFELHDVVVQGGPWDTRVATRFSERYTMADGTQYTNEAMAFLRLRWGKVTAFLMYPDTQTAARAAEQLAKARDGV